MAILKQRIDDRVAQVVAASDSESDDKMTTAACEGEAVASAMELDDLAAVGLVTEDSRENNIEESGGEEVGEAPVAAENAKAPGADMMAVDEPREEHYKETDGASEGEAVAETEGSYNQDLDEETAVGLNVGDICEEIPEGLAVENTGKETAEHLAAEGLGGATDASEGEALAGHTEEAGRVNDDQAINDPGNREEAEVIEPREGEAVAAEAVVVADDSNASSVDAAAAANIPKDTRKHDGGAVAPVPRPDDAETAAEVRVAAVASVAIRPALVSYRRRSDASRAGAARRASDSAPVGPEWRIPAKHHWNPDSASSRGLCSGHLRYVRQTKLGWDILAYNTINEDSVPREEFVMDGQLKLERVGETQGRAGKGHVVRIAADVRPVLELG